MRLRVSRARSSARLSLLASRLHRFVERDERLGVLLRDVDEPVHGLNQGPTGPTLRASLAHLTRMTMPFSHSHVQMGPPGRTIERDERRSVVPIHMAPKLALSTCRTACANQSASRAGPCPWTLADVGRTELKLRKPREPARTRPRFSVRWRKRRSTFSLCSCGFVPLLQSTNPLLYPLSYGGVGLA